MSRDIVLRIVFTGLSKVFGGQAKILGGGKRW